MSVVKVRLAESEADLKACMNIRRVVFMGEQQSTEDEEFDGLDDSCVHFAASVDSKIVGTCRMRKVRAFIKLERVAVLAESRMYGVGRAMNEAAFAYARQNHPTLLLMAHAQTDVLNFYGRQGMVPVSDVFYEAGLAHKTVILVPSRDRIPLLDIWKESIESSGQPACAADESDNETVIENMKVVLKQAMEQVNNA
jgi:predicted GNAT family N-acyltransferase